MDEYVNLMDRIEKNKRDVVAKMERDFRILVVVWLTIFLCVMMIVIS